MRGWVVALIVILAILMVGISALVAYLLYRPRSRRRSPKKRLPTDGHVATKYADPPENGEVKVAIPDDGDGTLLPPYSSKDSSLKKGKPDDVKVIVDDDSQPDDKALLEVKVDKPNERPVDVGQLEGKAPERPQSSDDDKKKFIEDAKESSSSSESDAEKEGDLPGGRKDEGPDKESGPKTPKEPDESSSSSSSDVETPKPMPLMEPHIVRDDEKKPRDETESPDLVTDVLAAVDDKQKKEPSSSSSSKDSASSSGDELPKGAKAKPRKVPKPKERTKRRPDEGRGPGDSSSSTSSDEEKIVPAAAPRPAQARKPSSSSSSSSESDKVTQAVPPPTRKRSKKKKTPAKSPRDNAERESSSSSSSDESVKLKVAKVPEKGSSSSSSDEERVPAKVAKPMIVPKEDDKLVTKVPEKSSSSSSSSDDEAAIRVNLRPRDKITFTSVWERPARLIDLYGAGLVDDDTLEGLDSGKLNKNEVELRLQPYLDGYPHVGGILISETGEKISVYTAWKRNLISREICLGLLEAQAATGRISDPSTGRRCSVEQACRDSLIDKQIETILSRAQRSVYGYSTRSSSEVLSVYQAAKNGIVVEEHAYRLLQAQIATGGVIDPTTNHRLPAEVAYKRGMLDASTNTILQSSNDKSRGFVDPNTNKHVTYQELMQRCVVDNDTRMRLLPLSLTRESSVTITPKKTAGVSMTTQTESTPCASSTSSSSESTSEAEMDISTHLGEMGTQTPFPSTKKKKRKVKKRPSMASSESDRDIYLYSQVGKPRHGPRPFSPPRTEMEGASRNEKSTQTLFAPRTKKVKKTKSEQQKTSSEPIVITLAEKEIQTVRTTSSSSSSSSAEEEPPVKPEVIHLYEKGIQMTESSSSSDEETKTRIRTQRDVSVERVEQRVISTGTYQRTVVTSETRHEVHTQPEPISVDLGRPEDQYTVAAAVDVSPAPKKIFFTTSWGGQADLNDLYEAGIVDLDMKYKLERGELEPTDQIVLQTITPYINGNRPVAGILLTDTGKKVTIFEAAKRGRIRRSTAVALLEAQAATGTLVDPHTGRKITVEEAQREGFIDGGYEAIIIRAERSVHGYKTRTSTHPLSVYEAMKQGIVVPSHGMQLLEAQLVTGGIIDPKANHRVPLNAAYRRRLFDQHMLNILNDASQKSFVDPNTQKNTTYQEIVAQCVTDLETGVLLFPLESQERGRPPTTKTNVLSATMLEVKSPSRSRSRERQVEVTVVQEKTAPKLSTSSSSASSDEEKRKITRDIKTSSTSIELTRTPVMSGEEDETFVRDAKISKQEDRNTEVTTVTTTTETYHQFEPVEMEIEKKEEGKMTKEEETKVSEVTMVTESYQEFEPVEMEIEVKGDDDKMTKEEETKVSEVTIVTESYQQFEPVEMEIEIKGEERKMAQEEDTKTEVSEITTTTEIYQQFEPVETEIEIKEVEIKEGEKKETSSGSSSSDDEKQVGESTTKTTTIVESADGSSSISTIVKTTTTEVVTTEIVTEKKMKRSRKDIKFRSGWNRQASLVDLFNAGVVTQETVDHLEQGIIAEEDVESNLKQYLVGAEPIAGLLLSETGEKISIYSAWRKGLIRRGTSISLLEAQAATGRILDPTTGNRYSVEEASKEGLIDRQFEAVLVRAERAVYGYTTRLSKDVISLFQAMKRGLVVENHGIRLLEAQIATGGIIDPNANHRLPVEVAYERGLFDKRMNEILDDPSDDTRGFFDPNTEENLTYLELMERCITNTDTGMRLLPLRTHRDTSTSKKSKVVFESRTGRQVTINDLVNSSRLDVRSAQLLESGTMSSEEKEVLVAKLRVFVDGTMPIAGVINTATGERMSIYEAAKAELIKRGTAFELLEAQACCGKLVDVQTGRVITIETALRSGVIDKEFKDVVERAHRAVTGYREPFKRELLSLCEAINRHLIVRSHGIRLLEAQVASGGIIDIKSPVRISPQVALKRALIDAKLAEDLEQKKTQSYFDPVTGENLNYSEMMGRCVTDKDTGMLYLMVEGGTVTSYVRPFEPEHTRKIRAQSASPGRLVSEEVKTTRSASTTKMGMDVTTTVESTESTKRKKKKSRRESGSSTSSAGNESTASESFSTISRKVIVVDPDTNEEITVREALKRRLIDKETARQLIAQQGEFEEPN